MARLAELLATLATTGGDGILTDRDTAHVIASGHDVLSRRSLPNLELHAKAVTDGIMARVRVRRGTTIARPIHLCFGVLDPAGVQRITMSVALEEGAHATFIAHCVFPRARRVEHLMDATVDVGPDATMVYREAHFHGPFGGIEVVPRATVRLARGSRFVSEFALTTGRVGRLAIDYTVEAGDAALAELTARVFGHATDHIRIRERVVLAGAAGRPRARAGTWTASRSSAIARPPARCPSCASRTRAPRSPTWRPSDRSSQSSSRR